MPMALLCVSVFAALTNKKRKKEGALCIHIEICDVCVYVCVSPVTLPFELQYL